MGVVHRPWTRFGLFKTPNCESIDRMEKYCKNEEGYFRLFTFSLHIYMIAFAQRLRACSEKFTQSGSQRWVHSRLVLISPFNFLG